MSNGVNITYRLGRFKTEIMHRSRRREGGTTESKKNTTVDETDTQIQKEGEGQH